jgi:hypothetical protein
MAAASPRSKEKVLRHIPKMLLMGSPALRASLIYPPHIFSFGMGVQAALGLEKFSWI